MKKLTATSTAPKLILLAFALAMPAINPTSARGDDGKKDESSYPKDATVDKKSDPIPPIVCDDGGDKKSDETSAPDRGRRRPPTPDDPGRCVDPAPTE